MIHAIVRGSSAEVGRGMSRSLPSTRTFTDGGANYKKNKSWSERQTTIPGKIILCVWRKLLSGGCKTDLWIIQGFGFE